MEPIAYTYEASEHCAQCTQERFGRNERGFIAEEATDNEGNPVGAVFSPFEDRDMVCGTCGDIIHTIANFEDEEEEEEDDSQPLDPQNDSPTLRAAKNLAAALGTHPIEGGYSDGPCVFDCDEDVNCNHPKAP